MSDFHSRVAAHFSVAYFFSVKPNLHWSVSLCRSELCREIGSLLQCH